MANLQRRARSVRKSRSHKPYLEQLEERQLLATWQGDMANGTVWSSGEVNRIIGNVRVPAGNTLTIEPGAIVKFDGGAQIQVDGTLLAPGTSQAPITITSIKDDSVGGDTGGDGPTTGSRGQWTSLIFTATSTGSTLDHVTLCFGGGFGASGELVVNGGALTLRDSALRDSNSNGVRITQATPTLTNTTFADNNGAAVSTDLASNPVIAGVTLSNNSTNGLVVDSGDLAVDNFWTNPELTYVLGGNVGVPLGRKLTIGAGQTIKSGGPALFVNGTLTAQGTALSPVIFTSIRDDSAGGDTNNNQNGDAPSNGDWTRIELGTSSTANVLDRVEVRYGGGFGSSAALVDNAPLQLTNSVIRNANNHGIRIIDATPTLTNNRFEANSFAAVSTNLGANPIITGVTAVNNFNNGLLQDGGTLTVDAVWTNPDIVYSLAGDLVVAAGKKLTIGAGQVIKSGGPALFVNGTLEARGTAPAPVIFTSIRDDSAGGDTNNNKAADGPANGDWTRVELGATSTANVLDRVEIRYGGGFGSSAALVDNAPLQLSNSVIRNANNHGIRIVDATPTLTNNRFEANNNAAVNLNLGANPIITGITVVNNFTNGLLQDGGTLTVDAAWTNPDIVYVLGGNLTVPADRKLTIGAGQIIKSGGPALFVNGTLTAQSTTAQPVIFTSIRDDSAGGDTNNNTDGDVPRNGDWTRIELGASSIANVLDHVEIRYGGGFGSSAALVDNAPLQLTNSVIRNSNNHGIRIVDATPTLTNNRFEANGFAAVNLNLGANPIISGVTVVNNFNNGLLQDGGTLTVDAVWTNPDIVYSLAGDLVVAAGKKLTIGAGQVIKSGGRGLFVNGTLDARGTAQAPVIFTSYRDDSAGGDTNNNQNGDVPSNGDWTRIELGASSIANVLDRVEIRYGGGFGSSAALVDNAPLQLTNSVIRNANNHGIRIIDATPTLNNNRFEANNGAAVNLNVGANPVISGVTVVNNFTNGLVVDPGTLTVNAAWTNPDIVYVLGGNVTVPADMKLTIGAGQIIKSGGPALFVNGTLTAQGTTAQPVIFTSIRDDSAGGDTNNNTDGDVPRNGDWTRIELGTSSIANVLDHVEIRYGGGFGSSAALVDNAPLQLSNSVIRNSNNHGIRISAANPTLTSNTFLDSSGAAISINLAANPVITGVTVSGNANNGLLVDSGDLTVDGMWTNPDIVYVLGGNVGVPADKKLTIGAGQVIKSAGPALFVNGTLDARGTALAPVIFTSIRDDSAGGDTNNNKAADGPANGDWTRVELGATSTANVLDRVEIRYGGGFGSSAALVDNAPLQLSNSFIRNSNNHGIRIVDANPTLTNNRFEANSFAAVSTNLGANPVITGVIVANNFTNGLLVDGGDLTVDGVWSNPDIVYVLGGNVGVPADKKLTIGAGQIIKSGGAGLFVSGMLKAQGTAVAPVIFTSIRDDSAGGDTNNNQNGDVPSNGDWTRIELGASSTANVLDRVEVRYGGGFGSSAALVDNAPLQLTNSVIRNSNSHGLLARTDPTVLVVNSLLVKNSDTGIRAEAGATVTAINNTIDGNFRGVAVNAATVVLTNNLVTNHARSGVFRDGSGTLNVTFNDVFNPTASSGNYEGLTDRTDLDGNLSVDPRYIRPDLLMYGLLSRSSVIDAGTSNGTPVSDFLGNPRFDDLGVANIGGGPITFYDMGALERQNASDPINLIVESASAGSNQVQIGDSLTLNWRVRNNQFVAAEGNWTDAVFASTDPVWDIQDTLVATVAHTGGLTPGAFYDAQATIKVPPKAAGTLYFIVRTDSRRIVRESIESDNDRTATTNLVVPELLLDTPFTKSFTAAGQSHYYQVTVPLGRTLKLNLDSVATSGSLAIYVLAANAPTPGYYDVRTPIEETQPDRNMIVPLTQTGTYYILVQSEFGAASTSAYTLTASAPGFKVNAISPAQAGTGGKATIRIEGSDLTSISQITLVKNSTIIQPVVRFYQDQTQMFATFDLTNVAPGSYDVHVVSQAESYSFDPATGAVSVAMATDGDVTLPAAFTVVAGGAPTLSTRLLLPSSVRFGATFPFQVDVANTGTNDLTIPVLRVGSPNGAPLSTTATVTAASTSELQILVLGNGADRTVLRPGEHVLVTLYASARVEPATELVVQDLTSPATPLEWDALESYYRDSSPDAAWAQTWANFKGIVGTNWGGLHNAMRRAALELAPTTDVTFLSGQTLIEDLLTRAAAGQHDATGFRPLKTGILTLRPLPDLNGGGGSSILGDEGSGGLPSGGGGGGVGVLGEPDYDGGPNPPHPDCCSQFRPINGYSTAALISMELKLSATAIPGLALLYGNRVREMYATYLHQDAPSYVNFSPVDDVVLGSLQANGFRDSPTTLDTVAMTLSRAKKALLERVQQGVIGRIGLDDLPANEEVLLLVEDLLGTDVLDSALTAAAGKIHLANKLEYNQDDIPGMLAGGIGKNGKGSDWYGDDRRLISGYISAKRVVVDGKTTKIILGTDLDIDVWDTVDFCPGNLSTGAERGITTVMGILEANGRAFDVGFHVQFATRKQFTEIPGSELPDDFMPDRKKDQPPTCQKPGMTDPNMPPQGPACDDSGKKSTPTVRSRDPNDIVGPAGVGPNNSVLPTEILPYIIHFENDPTQATAPALDVVVTNVLDDDLDLTTFELGPVGFGSHVATPPDGSQFWTTTVSTSNLDGTPLLVQIEAKLDRNARKITWTFRSIDPATGDVPADALAGFLPPNDATGRGDGFVSYRIRPNSNAATETHLSNGASIVFDINEPLGTNQIFNTTDSAAPTSSIVPLQAVVNVPLLSISWQGDDGLRGSGIATFDVYMSDNDGPFVPFLLNTTQTQMFFDGTPGHRYGFYSVATDRLGHRQATPTAAQATVFVNRKPTLDTIGAMGIAEGHELTFTVSGSDPDLPAQALTFAVTGLPAGSSFDPATRTFRWTPTEAQGPGSYNLTFTVSDGSATTSEDIAIQIVEVNTAPILQPIGARSVAQGTRLSITITGNDSDVPANTLTYSATNLPAGATFDPATRVFSWTPGAAQSPGTFNVTFTVSDGTLTDSEMVTFTVTEPNTAPVLQAIGARSVTEGSLLSFTITGTDSDIPPQTLTFSATNLPAGATFDAPSRTFSWTPNANQGPGTYDVTFTVSDGSLSASETVRITVADSPHPGQIQFATVEATVAEKDGNLVIVIRRGNGSDGAVSVGYTISIPTTLSFKLQATAGQDFQGAPTGTINFGAGETEKTLTIPIARDQAVELDGETFVVTLQAPTGGATLGTATVFTAHINESDLPDVPNATPNLKRLELAAQGFGKSVEHYRDFVRKAYRRFLDREPDEAGFTYWVSLMKLYEDSNHKEGLRQENIEAGFLNSAEYKGRYGGIGQAWIEGIYKDLLGRPGEKGGIDYWMSRLAAGDTPASVALGFTASEERLRNRVNDTYRNLLDREADQPGLEYWVAIFKQGFTTEDIVSGFVGSIEYYNKPDRGGSNPAKWVRSAYLDVLFRPASTADFDYWLRFLKDA